MTARAVVIATGSAPSVPKSFRDLPNILTSDNVFALGKLPSSLAVIGAGPLGLELAQALARLGVEVEVFDEGSSVSGLHDSAATQTLIEAFTDAFELHQNVTVQPRAHADGVLLRWSGRSSGERLFSHVLAATGRTPCLSDPGLGTTGLAISDDGVPVYNRHTMQCGDAPVFLAGDVTKDNPVLHEASVESALAGANAARFPAIESSGRSIRLAITFTDPQSAIIGSEPGPESLIASSDYDDQGRAVIEARAIGRIVVYAGPDGTLTGATLVAPVQNISLIFSRGRLS